MEKKFLLVSAFLVIIFLLFGSGGCEIPTAKFERTVQLSAPLSAGHSFKAETHNGAITVDGREEEGCEVTAVITGRAKSVETAKDIADRTKVELKNSGNKITVEITKPILGMYESVNVSLDVKLPSKTNILLLGTHNGSVTVSNIQGKVDGTTHNGRVKASEVSGEIKLKTHNGGVTCDGISGNAWMRTHNGSIKTSYTADAPNVCEILLRTHNGSIDLKTPPNISAAVDVSTHNGSIKTDLPITVRGTVSKKRLQGKIGEGLGKLELSTHNGSIKIR
ncbi:MAG: DUF4097 family beta strand repeat protein [Phycisphaerae bacterium]|nr:DUF4097 domain-containing protein [Phycisphaerae bacterium]NIS50202.1 DUF4097 domain-containing protein [Phycisphaerae bacterium]NIU11453.1 DUF4097 domain-containing protein [Phycisphaerae bacterium]NIU56502.1 DUF4097 family beta strand repeat protein [Phycisphaerae bacterium]NIV01848.1 DUF4097 family beta strand repeat protein [Phycisphaerae bacterium]